MLENYYGLLIGFAVGVLACVILYIFLKRSKAPDKIVSLPQSKHPESLPKPQQSRPAVPQNQELITQLRQNLRLKVMYDEAKIDRLIDFERQRNPNGNEVELMQAAIERWERQNR